MATIKDFIVKNGLQVLGQGNAASTSTQTGSLVVTGGVGVGNSLNVGAYVNAAGGLYSQGPFNGTFGSGIVVDSSVAGAGRISVGNNNGVTFYNNGVAGTPLMGIAANGIVTITSNSLATNTLSGALQVNGGVGIGGSLYVGQQLYVNNVPVITTATIGNYGVTALYAGTDTVVSANTGTVTVYSNATLNSITNRAGGNTTSNQIIINNTTLSTSSFSNNALYVAGGIGSNSGLAINGPSYMNGNLTVNGYITATNVNITTLIASSGTFYGDATGNGALYAGIVGGTIFPETVIQATGNYNGYMEFNIQNINASNQASTDVVASADNVTANSAYIDMGIASSTFDGTQPNSLGQAVGPNDGYLMVGYNTISGRGDLVLGTQTTGTQIRFVLGNGATTITNAMIAMIINTATTQVNSTNTGALQVVGGVGVSGGMFVGGIITSTSHVVSGTTSATSTTTGALQVAGGVGIGGSLWVGGDLYVDGGLIWANSNNIQTSDKVLYLATASTTATAAGSGIAIGPTATSYVSLTFDGSASWQTLGNINPKTPNTYNLGASANQYLNIYGNALFDNNLRVVTTVAPTAGTGISVTSLTTSGPSVSFTVNNTGVTNLNGSTGNVNVLSGNFINVTTASGSVTVSNNGVWQVNGSTGSVNILAGTAINVSTATDIVTITNLGVTATIGTTFLAVSAATGTVTLTNLGVTQVNGSTGTVNVLSGTDISVTTGSGTVTITNTATLQSTTNRGNSTTNAIIINNPNNASGITTATSGALYVAGGAAIAQSLYVGTQLYVGGVPVITTASIGNYGVTALFAGTDTAISANTGTVTVWSTATLASVTGRAGPGYAAGVTPNAISIQNSTASTGTASGALIVQGGAGVGGNLYVGGTTYLAGDLYVDGTQFVVNSTSISTTDKILYLSTNSASATLAGNSGISVGPTTQTYVSLTFDGVSSWRSYGNILPSGSQTLGTLGTAWNAIYGTAVYDNTNRVITNVTPSGGTGISISGLTASGPSVTFTVNNTGVTSLTGTPFLAVSSNTGSVTLTNLGVAQVNGSTGSVNILQGTAIGITTASGTITINNYGVTAAVGTTYLGVSQSTGSVTFTNLGVQTLTAGTDTVVTSSTGTVTVYNNSTLQTITNRGASTSNPISITSAVQSASTNSTQALLVTGGIGAAQVTATTVSAASLLSGNSIYTSYTSPTISTSSQVTLDSFSTSTYRTAKYTVQIVDTGFSPNQVHCEELLVMHDGAGTAYLNNYGLVYNISTLGTFDASFSTGTVTLLFTPSYTPTSMTVKVVRTGITT